MFSVVKVLFTSNALPIALKPTPVILLSSIFDCGPTQSKYSDSGLFLQPLCYSTRSRVCKVVLPYSLRRVPHKFTLLIFMFPASPSANAFTPPSPNELKPMITGDTTQIQYSKTLIFAQAFCQHLDSILTDLVHAYVSTQKY